MREFTSWPEKIVVRMLDPEMIVSGYLPQSATTKLCTKLINYTVYFRNRTDHSGERRSRGSANRVNGGQAAGDTRVRSGRLRLCKAKVLGGVWLHGLIFSPCNLVPFSL
jgi:hypothetical protein